MIFILLFKTIDIYNIDIDIFAHKNHLMLWKSINSNEYISVQQNTDQRFSAPMKMIYVLLLKFPYKSYLIELLLSNISTVNVTEMTHVKDYMDSMFDIV